MKEVLITGAGSGIGAATAKIFSQNNYKVYLVGRTLKKLEAIQKELPHESLAIGCDQSKKDDIEKLYQKLVDLKADISVLVNNAAIYLPAPFSEQDDEAWVSQINTNLLGPIRLTKKLWPMLLKNQGCITNISSTLGLRPIENTSSYSATKAAINSWTQALALEGGPYGVRVNAICPGLVDTPIHQFHNSDKKEDKELYSKLQGLQPMGRIGQPMDIATAAYYISSEDASWMTGALLPVDGGVILTTRNI